MGRFNGYFGFRRFLKTASHSSTSAALSGLFGEPRASDRRDWRKAWRRLEKSSDFITPACASRAAAWTLLSEVTTTQPGADLPSLARRLIMASSAVWFIGTKNARTRP